MVVKLNPVADHAAGVLQSLETMPVRALFLQSVDYPLHYAILLRAVRCYELLLETIATHQSREGAAGEDQAPYPRESRDPVVISFKAYSLSSS